jgi:hypothetical protein
MSLDSSRHSHWTLATMNLYFNFAAMKSHIPAHMPYERSWISKPVEPAAVFFFFLHMPQHFCMACLDNNHPRRFLNRVTLGNDETIFGKYNMFFMCIILANGSIKYNKLFSAGKIVIYSNYIIWIISIYWHRIFNIRHDIFYNFILDISNYTL